VSYRITIEPAGHTVEASDGQTILDACLRAGVWLPHACGHGLCATCKATLLDGDVDLGDASPFALMDCEREERKLLACCAVAQSDVTIEADVDEEPDARHFPVADFSASVSHVERLSPTIRGLTLELPGGGIRFQAGQYIQLQVPFDSRPRAFSIASPPSSSNLIELNVRRVADGAATTWLHEALRRGDTLRFSGPFGRFFVRESDPRPLLFLAGGSGLSSPRSMIRDLLERGDGRPITLMFGARNRAELYYHDEFVAAAAKYPNFSYVPALSEPTADCEWHGTCGCVHEAAREHFNGDFRGLRAYLCGPPPMIEACIRVLMQGRLFERDIFTERFVTAADGAGALSRSPLFRNL
jgi:phenol/toluene 2-monooxygenase (NADH) P5/A5